MLLNRNVSYVTVLSERDPYRTTYILNIVIFYPSCSQITVFSFNIFLEAGIPVDKIRYVTLGIGASEVLISITCVSKFHIKVCNLKSNWHHLSWRNIINHLWGPCVHLCLCACVGAVYWECREENLDVARVWGNVGHYGINHCHPVPEGESLSFNSSHWSKQNFITLSLFRLQDYSSVIPYTTVILIFLFFIFYGGGPGKLLKYLYNI